MTACAIDAVEFEFVIDQGSCEEAFELGDAHFLDIFEDHVVGDQFDSGIDIGAGEAEVEHHFLGHFRPELIVSVEANASIGIDGESAWFAYIVKEDGEDEGCGYGGWEEAEHDSRVDEDIAFGVELGWLLASFEIFDFGKDLSEEPALIE